VINAGGGDLAIRLSSQTSFDAVVCDARLVGRDGKSIASSLRATAGCASARFILSSAEPLNAEQMHVSAGDAVVVRPYDVEELRRLIEGD
jgi:DNA-binding response OmpR family regulator